MINYINSIDNVTDSTVTYIVSYVDVMMVIMMNEVMIRSYAIRSCEISNLNIIGTDF